MQTSLFSPAEELFRRAAVIRAIQGGDVNIFSEALAKLESVSQRLGSPIAIVGGLAGIQHQAMITTLDIDIVVSRDRLDDFLRACVAEGLEIKRQSDRGWHAVMYRSGDESVEIQVVPEGENSPRDPDYAPATPGPAALGVTQGLGYASFGGWVALKLVANREKDRYHLIEALKKASQAQIAEAVVKLRPLDTSYLREFERLVRAAEDENQENW